MTCILCFAEEANIFWEQVKGINWRTYGREGHVGSLKYYQCGECHLIFKDPAVFPNTDIELKIYLQHNNCLDNQGYLDFIGRVLNPLLERKFPGMKVLDFGSGPTPVLQKLLQREGIDCAIYDPYFAPALEVIEGEGVYDFITCTEVIEHIYSPLAVFENFQRIVKPGGSLIVMTQAPPLDQDEFRMWWYHRDPSHVAFYGKATFSWIANAQEWRGIEFLPDGVTLLTR